MWSPTTCCYLLSVSILSVKKVTICSDWVTLNLETLPGSCSELQPWSSCDTEWPSCLATRLMLGRVGRDGETAPPVDMWKRWESESIIKTWQDQTISNSESLRTMPRFRFFGWPFIYRESTVTRSHAPPWTSISEIAQQLWHAGLLWGMPLQDGHTIKSKRNCSSAGLAQSITVLLSTQSLGIFDLRMVVLDRFGIWWHIVGIGCGEAAALSSLALAADQRFPGNRSVPEHVASA